jgi:hypothetical protein
VLRLHNADSNLYGALTANRSRGVVGSFSATCARPHSRLGAGKGHWHWVAGPRKSSSPSNRSQSRPMSTSSCRGLRQTDTLRCPAWACPISETLSLPFSLTLFLAYSNARLNSLTVKCECRDPGLERDFQSPGPSAKTQNS